MSYDNNKRDAVDCGALGVLFGGAGALGFVLLAHFADRFEQNDHRISRSASPFRVHGHLY